MKVSTDWPPNIKEIREAFDLEGLEVVFTYGDTIYNPFKGIISPHLHDHEETHMRQQQAYEGGAAAWWKRYLKDPEFRVSQELEAYGRQYRTYCKTVKERNYCALFLHELAKDFSGPMYGNCISTGEAQAAIRKSSHG